MAPVLDRYSDLRPPVPDHAPPYSQVYLTELANWRRRADERHFKTKQREYRERRRAKVEMTMEEREAARVEKEGAEKAKKEALAKAQAELVERAKKRREESLKPCECHVCAEVAGTSLFRSLSRAPKVRRDRAERHEPPASRKMTGRAPPKNTNTRKTTDTKRRPEDSVRVLSAEEVATSGEPWMLTLIRRFASMSLDA